MIAPPPWLPVALLIAVMAATAVRGFFMRRAAGVELYGFRERDPVQAITESGFRLLVIGLAIYSAVIWAAPSVENALGRPEMAAASPVRWVAAGAMLIALLTVLVAQHDMGASLRVGVPTEGPGALVSQGVFRWSRNPIFVGLLLWLAAMVLWSPTVVTAALAGAGWVMTLVQVRVEEGALEAKHGVAYRNYMASVGRWFGRRKLPAQPQPGPVHASATGK